MTTTANFHLTFGSRTWVCQWTSGSVPVSGWMDTTEYDLLFDDSDGEYHRHHQEVQPYNRPPPSRGAKLAGCMCSTMCNFITSVVVAFLLWLIFFRPYKVRPHVDAASLAAFDLIVVPGAGTGNKDNATALEYDLALKVTFFNDHRIIYDISFDHLTMGLYYHGTKLGGPLSDAAAPLPTSFKLRTRRHRTVYTVLRGRAGSNVVDAAMAGQQLAADLARGMLDVDVRMKTTLTYRFWPYRATYLEEYDCLLRFEPPPGDGTPAITGGVKCGMRLLDGLSRTRSFSFLV